VPQQVDAQSSAARPATGPPAPWRAAIPLWRSSVVLRQVFTVFAAGVVFVWLLVTLLEAARGDLTGSTFWSLTRVFLIILAGLVVLAFLLLALFYRRYEYLFALDDEGVSASTAGGTRKKNAVVNAALVLSGRPSAMGAGMLASSRQDQRVRWKDVDSFAIDSKRRQIALRRRRHAIVVVQCTEENLEAIGRFVEAHVAREG
jgi:hypothetical protein